MIDKVIKNISYKQSTILKNIMSLHNNDNPFECDITYSKGNFYGTFKDDELGEFTISQPLYKFDVLPLSDDVKPLDPWGNIPLEDNSINSIVIDLPFIISPKTAPSVKENKDNSNIIFKRFHSYYPYTELIKSYKHWIEEAFRVLKDNGICVFKCQNNISGGKFYCSEEISWFFAQQCGFYVLDKFTCIAKTRLISGKIKKQQHSRNFTSTFWVFKKNGKYKPIDYDINFDKS